MRSQKNCYTDLDTLFRCIKIYHEVFFSIFITFKFIQLTFCSFKIDGILNLEFKLKIVLMKICILSLKEMENL